MSKLFLFGASSLGEIAYEFLSPKNNIVGFIDNDPNKEGKLFCSQKIFSPDVLIADKDSYVIICSMYDLEIANQLINLGIKKFGVFNPKDQKGFVQHFDYTNIYNFSIKNNKICVIVKNHSGSNTLALYKSIYTELGEKYEIVVSDENNRTHNYYYDLLTSKVILATHDIRCNPKQITIQLWHGFPLKGLSYMSNYQNQNKEANHIAWSKLDYIVSYSQTYSTFINSCYGIDGSKYKVLGMPRNDFLFEKESRKYLEKVLNLELGEKKIIFYMPTFRNTIYGEKNGDRNSFLTTLSKEELNKFNAFLEKNNVLLLMKLHPEEESSYLQTNHICLLKETDLVDNHFDLYEILGCADVLITDYSSVYFDFLLLDKPIIFYTPDYEVYEKERGFLLEPFDFWAPGEKCKDLDSLKQVILNNLHGEDHYQRNRELVRNIVHRYQDNQSSQRVWNFVDEILSGEKGST